MMRGLQEIGKYFFGVVLVLAVGAVGGESSGKEVPVPATQAAGEEVLGNEYVDKNFGYSIRPPAGCVGSLKKMPGPAGSLELAQFVSTKGHSWLTVRYSQAERAIKQEELLAGLKVEAVQGLRDAKVHRGELTKVCGRPAAVCEVTYEEKGTRLVRHQSVIQFQPDEVFIVTYSTRETEVAASRATFAAVLASFTIPEPGISRKSLGTAIARGIQWLSELRSRDWSDVLVQGPSYWRYESKGKPIGFLRVREESKVQDGRLGVQIHERAWFFGDGKSYRDVQNTMFLSLDLQSESWENLAQSRAEVDGKILLTHDLNKGLRGEDQLALAYTERAGDAALARTILKVPESYLPMALVRMFSRLADVTKAESYAFSSYDVESREMVVRVVRILGRTKAKGIDHSGPAFKVEDNVGLLPPAMELYTDAKGRILRVVRGDLVMEASTRSQVEAMFKEQMAAADDLYKRSIAEQERALRQLLGPAAEKAETPKDPGRKREDGRGNPERQSR